MSRKSQFSQLNFVQKRSETSTFYNLSKIFSFCLMFYQGAGRIMVTRSHAAIPISTVLVADFIQGLKGIAIFLTLNVGDEY